MPHPGGRPLINPLVKALHRPRRGIVGDPIIDTHDPIDKCIIPWSLVMYMGSSFTLLQGHPMT